MASLALVARLVAGVASCLGVSLPHPLFPAASTRYATISVDSSPRERCVCVRLCVLLEDFCVCVFRCVRGFLKCFFVSFAGEDWALCCTNVLFLIEHCCRKTNL